MTEYELDKIKKSFVRSNAKCPVEVACLLTVIKYYNGKETDIHTLTEWCKINGKLTLAGMKQGAIYSGMKAEICLQNRHYKIFCVNGNTGFRNESRIFYFIHLQNEEAYERKESSSA